MDSLLLVKLLSVVFLAGMATGGLLAFCFTTRNKAGADRDQLRPIQVFRKQRSQPKLRHMPNFYDKENGFLRTRKPVGTGRAETKK
jgi:hypothetical protein